MWVGMAAAFAFELRRILGRTVRNFFGKIARKAENFSKSRNFRRESGGNGAEMRRGRLGGSTEVWKITGAAVALRAGVHGRNLI